MINLSFKKALSLLLILCMLVTVFMPFSVNAQQEQIYKLTFKGESTGAPFYALTDKNNLNSAEININFDYYVKNARGRVAVVNLCSGETLAALNQGFGSVNAKIPDFSGNIAIGLKLIDATEAQNTDVYLKNLSITADSDSFLNLNTAQAYGEEVSISLADAFPSEEATTAYVIDFDSAKPNAFWTLSKDTWSEAKNNPAIVKFDYFLDGKDGEFFVENVASGGGYKDAATDSSYLKSGLNTFSYYSSAFDRSGFCVGIKSNNSNFTKSRVYIWNIEITLNNKNYFGTDVTQWGGNNIPTLSSVRFSDIPTVVYTETEENTVNYAYLPYEEGIFISPYDNEANTLRKEILELTDTAPSTTRVYYVSESGSDSNSGLSPQKAWKTTAKVSSVPNNSTVLFERGGVYRGTINLKNNVTYAAYGTGDKPQILGSPQNYAVQSLWTEYSENIWQITLENSQDVGNIVFDDGKKCAVRVIRDSSEEQLSTKLSYLTADYMYLYEDDKVYLYLTSGNPASVHNSIEVVARGYAPAILSGKLYGLHDVTIENLCLKYGNYGINTAGGYNYNIHIRGCEIGYIGGCLMESGIVRAGNAIELWSPICDSSVTDCWVYQVYDAGITHQGSGENSDYVVEDVVFSRNLVEFCQYSIEFFNSYAATKNVTYSDNILRFAGYQVFDPKRRYGSASDHTSLINAPWYDEKIENVVIENNILDTSYGYLIKGSVFNDVGGTTVRNNKYCQQTGLPTYFYEVDYYDIIPSVFKDLNDKVYSAVSQFSLDSAVEIMDPTAKEVIYIMNKQTDSYKLLLEGNGAFYTLSEDMLLDSKAVNISFDYYYGGSDDELSVINLSNFAELGKLKNGFNSFSFSNTSFSGELCIGISANDLTDATTKVLFIENVVITAGGSNAFVFNGKQYYCGDTPYIAPQYEAYMPSENEAGVNNTAYLIDFSNTTSGSPYFTISTDPQALGKEVKVSFDYYLENAENREIEVSNIAGGSFYDNAIGKSYLFSGRNRFEATTEKCGTSTMCVRIRVSDKDVKSNAKIYIWNISITVNGVDYFSHTAKQFCTLKPLPTISTLEFNALPCIGDSNADGAVNVLDLIRLKRNILNGKYVEFANSNLERDGAINALDLVALKKVILA